MKLPVPTSDKAFSLVEVTIAMAIAAVGVISILGLIPQGQKTMREAGDEAIQGRIHQQILNEIQMTPFKANEATSPIDKFNNLEIYYDDQGEELADSTNPGEAKGSFRHIYTARVNLPKAGEDKAPQSVGGGEFKGVTFSGDDNDVNQFIRPVIIEIAAVGGLGANFDWDEEDNRSMISTYQTFVVQMGHDLSAPTTP